MSNEAKKEVAKTADLRTFIESDKVQAEIAKALPQICTPERFLRVSMTAITKTPKLLECERTSFVAALLDCASLGIEPDGRRAHLIPFFNKKKNITECQLIIDYKGLVELVMRSGKIRLLHADKICDNDVFEYNAGKIIEHKIDFKKPRGKAYAYYSYAEMKDGSQKSEVMTLEEINGIKSRSKSQSFGPWVTDFDEMAKKTVFKRLSKWLQLSPEDSQVLQKVDAQEFDFDMKPPKPEFAKPEDLDL